MPYTSLQFLPASVVELAEPHYQDGKGGDMQTINELFATPVPGEYRVLPSPCGWQSGNRGERDPIVAEIASTSSPAGQRHP